MCFPLRLKVDGRKSELPNGDQFLTILVTNTLFLVALATSHNFKTWIKKLFLAFFNRRAMMQVIACYM